MKLAKDYSKERHLDLLPRCNNNILDKLDYIYDENWENQGVPYPYEILTYLFDSYYVLPERPDLAALFCWQAINHSYYVQQLSDNNVGFCQDTKGIELIRDAILGDWNNKYRQRVCAVCGSTYWPTHSQQKFCSEECQKINHNEKSLEFYHKKQKEKSECKDLLQTKELVSSTNSSEIITIPA